jgi:methyl-CpG-binding domain protein 4
VSPFGLLEEELWQQPWRLLLGCLLLNKTTSKQVG